MQIRVLSLSVMTTTRGLDDPSSKSTDADPNVSVILRINRRASRSAGVISVRVFSTLRCLSAWMHTLPVRPNDVLAAKPNLPTKDSQSHWHGSIPQKGHSIIEHVSFVRSLGSQFNACMCAICMLFIFPRLNLLAVARFCRAG